MTNAIKLNNLDCLISLKGDLVFVSFFIDNWNSFKLLTSFFQIYLDNGTHIETSIAAIKSKSSVYKILVKKEVR